MQISVTYLFEFFPRYDIVVTSLLMCFLRPRGMTNLPLKYTLVFLQNLLNQGILTNTRWTNNNDWLSFERCWIEWAEIFFGEYEYIILDKNKQKRLLIVSIRSE